jgi:hypothetical protein
VSWVSQLPDEDLVADQQDEQRQAAGQQENVEHGKPSSTGVIEGLSSVGIREASIGGRIGKA